jgi:hypothetical protein
MERKKNGTKNEINLDKFTVVALPVLDELREI